VLGSDESPCSLSAVERFLAGHTPRATCARGPLPLIPDEPVPVRLADVKPAPRAPRSVARLLNAVDLTIDDVESQAGTQAVLLFSGDSDAPIAGGGLRAGRFREKPDAVSLRGIVFVPGVHVSGRLLNRGARIGSFRVTADGKRGRVEYRGGGYVTGHFGGHSFRVKLRIDDGKPPVIQLGKHLRPEAPPPPRAGR
jgi:hypothetical protein